MMMTGRGPLAVTIVWVLMARIGAGPLRADEPPRPVPLAESAGRMTLPEGFRATLFAGEPAVHQPIAMTIDPRGRLWVVECHSYPIWLGGPRGQDRVLILEDTDGDGSADRRKVFWQGGTSLTGIALGFGGAWLCATPNLLFIPDADGDDVPDGEPVVKLDGWDTEAQHNMFNTLTWAPDGWLWGCNGILSNSRVGKPGTPDERRTPINCGVWRFHPTREVFEVVAHGTTNPWGLDFDDYGEAFITNCVIPHLFHVVPGAHFQRMYGQDFNPHAYELMPTCADHVHWDTVEQWSDIRRRGVTPTTDQAGGGHAHVGAMIYLGDNWPDAYRDTVLTCNVHGHRVNHDRLHRKGSSYVATHAKDFLLANDTWFRGLELKYGPDGGVFLTDWSDIGECHENDADNAHRENGRIYKIVYRDARPAKVDLGRLDDLALVEAQLNRNDWYVRNARRLLQERSAAGKDLSAARRRLAEILDGHPDVTRRLRALWALHATGGVGDAKLRALLDGPDEHLRAWSIRLLVDAGAPEEATLERLARSSRDPSPKVRLALASALQRLSLEARAPIAEGLLARGADADDRPLVLMIWYGIEPLAAGDPDRGAAMAGRASVPQLRRFLARRVIATDAPRGLAALLPKVESAGDPARLDLLAGIHDALRGRKHVPMPDGWDGAFANLSRSDDAAVRERAAMVGLLVNDDRAIEMLRTTLTSRGSDITSRRRALEALAERRVPGLAPALRRLLDEKDLRRAAIRALAAYEDRETPEALLARYATLSEAERDDAVATLAARPAYAKALIGAIGAGTVPRRDVNATVARQILAFDDPELTRGLGEAWGTLRPTARDKATLLGRYKEMLTSGSGRPADPSRGRAIFNKACLQCHKLFGAGGDVGPELTGSDRANVDYVLENVLDPGASVGRDFQLATVATTDGRLLTGIIRAQDDTSLTVQTINERIILPREDVEEVQISASSMMPEGLLEPLAPDEVRDLFTYLSATSQVPMPDGER
jgi:putative membrane-bound dehydrogenase-like protein